MPAAVISDLTVIGFYRYSCFRFLRYIQSLRRPTSPAASRTPAQTGTSRMLKHLTSCKSLFMPLAHSESSSKPEGVK